jgi:hypothetical protein
VIGAQAWGMGQGLMELNGLIHLRPAVITISPLHWGFMLVLLHVCAKCLMVSGKTGFPHKCEHKRKLENDNLCRHTESNNDARHMIEKQHEAEENRATCTCAESKRKSS